MSRGGGGGGGGRAGGAEHEPALAERLSALAERFPAFAECFPAAQRLAAAQRFAAVAGRLSALHVAVPPERGRPVERAGQRWAGAQPLPSTRPGGDRPAIGSKPGQLPSTRPGAERPGIGSKPGGERPGIGTKPGQLPSTRPGIGSKPGGDRPGVGDRPGSATGQGLATGGMATPGLATGRGLAIGQGSATGRGLATGRARVPVPVSARGSERESAQELEPGSARPWATGCPAGASGPRSCPVWTAAAAGTGSRTTARTSCRIGGVICRIVSTTGKILQRLAEQPPGLHERPPGRHAELDGRPPSVARRLASRLLERSLGRLLGEMWAQHPVWSAFAVTGWAWNAANYLFGTAPYYNPYWDSGYSSSVVYDYSQPIVTYSEPAAPATESAAPAGAEALPPGVSEPALSTFDQARVAFHEGDYKQALELANQTLKEMPTDAAVHEFLALCLFALGEYKPAAATLNAVLAVGPGWDWTTMSSLYADADVYTAQLRKLEQYVKATSDRLGRELRAGLPLHHDRQHDGGHPAAGAVVKAVPQGRRWRSRCTKR